jgi:UV DNA damage endonuclease
MRLGFPVKVLGQPGLKSHDSRRWQNHPHLSVSLAYLRDIFVYLGRQSIYMYRMASDLAPYAAHPEMPQFHNQIDECAKELAIVGDMARNSKLRLSFHVTLSTVLNALDESIADQSAEQVRVHARILDSMGLGPEAVVVTHVGGVYGDKEASLKRFIQRYEQLPEFVRQRLAVENDDARFSVGDIALIHQETGVRLVFDYLHFENHNPEGMSLTDALDCCLRSCPTGVKPKVHFSSPRTAMHVVEGTSAQTEASSVALRAPRSSEHADFVDPFQFTNFIRAARSESLPTFDAMIEVKAKDLAVLRLREHLARLAPEVESN